MSWGSDTDPFLKTARWQRLRLSMLERDQWLCQCPECKRLDRVTPANEVDHIVPRTRGGTHEPSNLRAVNTECHKVITLEQMGKRRTVQFGFDGRPKDGAW